MSPSRPAKKPIVQPEKPMPESVSKEAEIPAAAPNIVAAPAPTPFPVREKPSKEPSAHSPKHSRRTPANQSRLHMNAGEENGVTPGDIVRLIQGETGLPNNAVGEIDIRQRHAFIDVLSEHARAIISKLNRTQLNGRKLRVKEARATESGVDRTDV
jgi:ATP-dependent RNA helicase DeaD